MEESILSLELAPQHMEKDKEELLELFDEEVERFSVFMGSLADGKAAGPLSKMEKALVKTFLVHKFRGRF